MNESHLEGHPQYKKLRVYEFEAEDRVDAVSQATNEIQQDFVDPGEWTWDTLRTEITRFSDTEFQVTVFGKLTDDDIKEFGD